MDKNELIQHHVEELRVKEKALRSWQDAVAETYSGFEKTKQEHISTIQKLVDFHRAAIEWLKNLA